MTVLSIHAIRSASWAIASHPLRSLALTLSLASAVACVVFSASVVGGFSQELERLAFGDYATTLVVRENGLVPSRRGAPSLDDRARLLEELVDVEGSAAWVQVTAPLRGRTETRSVTVFGVSGDYRRELDAKLQAGRWLTPDEVEGAERICLVGAGLAFDLGHRDASVLGKDLSLGGPRCRVVGVLDYAETRPAGRFNDAAITPFASARRHFDIRPPGEERVPGPREATWLSFFMPATADMRQIKVDTDRVMRRAAGVPMSRESPYSYDDPGADILEQVRQRDALARLLWVLTAAALVASLVGYGGIAFATTAGRRREIALRLAMGADARAILTQISVEHLLIGAAASVAGLTFGVVGAAAASRAWDWPMRLDWTAGFAAVLMGCGLGLTLGLLAARDAAATPPSLAAKG